MKTRSEGNRTRWQPNWPLIWIIGLVTVPAAVFHEDVFLLFREKRALLIVPYDGAFPRGDAEHGKRGVAAARIVQGSFPPGHVGSLYETEVAPRPLPTSTSVADPTAWFPRPRSPSRYDKHSSRFIRTRWRGRSRCPGMRNPSSEPLAPPPGMRMRTGLGPMMSTLNRMTRPSSRVENRPPPPANGRGPSPAEPPWTDQQWEQVKSLPARRSRAMTLFHQNKLTEAIAEAENIVSIESETLGAVHDDVGATLRLLVLLHGASGNRDATPSRSPERARLHDGQVRCRRLAIPARAAGVRRERAKSRSPDREATTTGASEGTGADRAYLLPPGSF